MRQLRLGNIFFFIAEHNFDVLIIFGQSIGVGVSVQQIGCSYGNCHCGEVAVIKTGRVGIGNYPACVTEDFVFFRKFNHRNFIFAQTAVLHVFFFGVSGVDIIGGNGKIFFEGFAIRVKVFGETDDGILRSFNLFLDGKIAR